MVVVLNLMQQQPPEAVMETTESAVPPGFRFHPTDEELVGYYLKKKVAMQKIDLDVIREIDLYRIEPWDIQERCRVGYEEQKEWYFFSHKDKKYPTGTRTNRATMAGFWKATGRDKAIYDKSNLIGMRKTLVFYKGRAPNGQKTDWIMHEYRLESEENGPPQEEGWVVCRAFKKRVTGQTKSIEGWDSSYLYDEQMDYIGRQSQNNFLPQNLPCKRDTEDDSLTSFTFSDQFVQLPQLESPSLPLMKRPCSSSASLISSEHNNGEDELVNGSKRVTDWRALDKFVASQLMSQEESFEVQNESDVALLMLQNSGEEVNKRLNLNGFLSTSSDCDIGICLFDK